MDWNRITEQFSKIKVKSVVDIPLKYALLILTLALFSSIFSRYQWVTITLFSFAGLLFIPAIFGYFYFSIKNPDYLRSEEFHIKKQSIELLGDKDNYLPVDTKNIVDIANPYQNQIEDTKDTNNLDE